MVCRLGFYVIQTLLTFFPVRLFHLPTFLYFYKGVASPLAGFGKTAARFGWFSFAQVAACNGAVNLFVGTSSGQSALSAILIIVV